MCEAVIEALCKAFMFSVTNVHRLDRLEVRTRRGQRPPLTHNDFWAASPSNLQSRLLVHLCTCCRFLDGSLEVPLQTGSLDPWLEEQHSRLVSESEPTGSEVHKKNRRAPMTS